MLSETRYEHIMLNEDQVPTIAGTTMKVIELVLDHIAYGWSPESCISNISIYPWRRFTLHWRTTGIIKRNSTKTSNAGFSLLTRCGRQHNRPRCEND